MGFSFYAYKDEPHVRRAKMFEPPTPAAKVEPSSVKAGEAKVKKINTETAGRPSNAEVTITKESTM